jgi:hypothetical protein
VRTVLLLVALVLGCVAFLAIAVRWGFERPLQAKLTERFYKSRHEYERLRDMIRDDGLATVMDSEGGFARHPYVYKTGRDVVGPKRAREYLSRLGELGCSRVDHDLDNGSVTFAFEAWGWLGEGWRVALRWSQEPPLRIVDTIDGLGPTPAGRPHPAVEVADDWYVLLLW